jgi:sugar phosphate isomerase/epimerase
MRDALGPGTILGYCTNVHAGATLDEVLANLDRYAVPIKRRVSPDQPMGVGLWLSCDAARAVVEEERIGELRDFLDSRGLLAYTFNGFPYGDFHQPRVKHAVYEPDWTTQARYDYTLTLALILSEILPDGAEGSISTLPIGWPSEDAALDQQRLDAAGSRLADLVHQLARLELDTGRHIHVNLEPEPGCLLDTADDVVGFFQSHLLGGLDDESVLGYLGVCHDVCHSAVMFEPQTRALDAYQAAGIMIGKTQLSSALALDFDAMDAAQREQAVAQLQGFAEDRYLHQTVIRAADGGQTLVTDLPEALSRPPAGRWRVHFHVPLFADTLGVLGTTREQVSEARRLLRQRAACRHFEVETYAWGVLPAAHAVADVAEGIARELEWVRGVAD